MVPSIINIVTLVPRISVDILVTRVTISITVTKTIILILVSEISLLDLRSIISLKMLTLVADNLSGIRWRSELLSWGPGKILLKPLAGLLEVLGLTLEILELLRLLEHLLRNSSKIWNSWLEGRRKVGAGVAKWGRSPKRILRHLQIQLLFKFLRLIHLL